MEKFEFIESAIILGLNSFETLKKFKHVQSDFVMHGDAYRFLIKYVDDYSDFPTVELLLESYPTLDISARDIKFDYALDKFKQQILTRQVIHAFQVNKDIIHDDPKKAYMNIMSALNDINAMTDEDIIHYDDKSLDRLAEWRARKERRELDGGLMGIPTPFDSINRSGVGWMDGDLIAMFARPTVGKTWMCAEMAATAMLAGIKTLFISTEMSTQSIMMRLDVILASKLGYELSHRALRHGEEINEELYSDVLKQLDTKNLLICDHISGQPSITIESIESLVRKHNPSFIVLDGIYLVSTGIGRSAMWEQSHELFYAMKNLCKAQNVAMCVSTQANRDAANMFEPPSASQVAFGDALIRAADVALSMCRVQDGDGDVNEPMRRVQVQKIRDSETYIDNMYMTSNVDKGEIKEMIGYEPYAEY